MHNEYLTNFKVKSYLFSDTHKCFLAPEDFVKLSYLLYYKWKIWQQLMPLTSLCVNTDNFTNLIQNYSFIPQFTLAQVKISG